MNQTLKKFNYNNKFNLGKTFFGIFSEKLQDLSFFKSF